jgi:hypothetical protein
MNDMKKRKPKNGKNKQDPILSFSLVSMLSGMTLTKKVLPKETSVPQEG